MHSKQYTIRNVPDRIDRVLRKRAKATGKSLNQIALEALADGAQVVRHEYDDLDFMIGTMSQRDADDLDKEIAAQRRVDADMWR